jgi:hypothetical protein
MSSRKLATHGAVQAVSSSGSVAHSAQPPSVVSDRSSFKLQQASSAIAGTAEGLKRKLKQLDAGAKHEGPGRHGAVLARAAPALGAIL